MIRVVKNNYNPAAVAGSLEDAEAANMENGREKRT